MPRLVLALGTAFIAFSATLIISFASSETPKAIAASHIFINDGNVPTTAEDFDHQCDPNQGGGPLPGQDVWVFVLPGNHGTTGDFVSVTAHYSEGDVTITTAMNPGNFSNGGPATSKAWIITPEGWTLEGAEADITGTADFFNLTHTCPAASSPSPSPSVSMSPSPSPSVSQSPSPSPSVSQSPSPSPSRSQNPPPPTMSPSVSPSPSMSRSPRPSPSTKPPGYGGGYDEPQPHPWG